MSVGLNSGPSICELLYRSGSGLTPRPLKRIASGGELSRVLLAAKVVMGSADHAGTLVFDEVDAGVGGATARSLATVLGDLAKTHQVIVVTHLAQVAVVADAHYVVRKADTGSGIPEHRLFPLRGMSAWRRLPVLSGDSSPESSPMRARCLNLCRNMPVRLFLVARGILQL